MTTLPILVIQPDELDPLGPLRDWLVLAGAELHELQPYASSWVPPDLADFSGVIVLGGHLCAHDGSEPSWLEPVRDLLARALNDRVPTLAICLGAQLLAQAAGGRVGHNPIGPEYGARLIAKRSAAATDPLFAALPITPDVVQWHRDAVLALPPGAVLLAASPGCDVEAFRVGNVAWGVQFHPEATPALVRSWIAFDREALGDYDHQMLLSRVEDVAIDLEQAWRPFFETFVEVLKDPSLAQRNSGDTVEPTVAAPISDPAQIRAMLAAEMQAARQPASGPVPIELGSRPEPPTEQQ